MVVQVHPPQLPSFHWDDENEQKHSFTLSNTPRRSSNSSLSLLFFKIKTTAPKHFLVKPSEGFISPGEEVYVTVAMKARMGPEDSQPRFQIRAARCSPEAKNNSPPDLYNQEEWANIERSGVGSRHVVECVRSSNISSGKESLQERIAVWRGKNADVRTRSMLHENNTIDDAAEKDLTRLREEYLELSGKFEKQKQSVRELEVAMTMMEQENESLRQTLHEQRELIVVHGAQREELMEQHYQQQQKLASFEEALRLERMAAEAIPNLRKER